MASRTGAAESLDAGTGVCHGSRRVRPPSSWMRCEGNGAPPGSRQPRGHHQPEAQRLWRSSSAGRESWGRESWGLGDASAGPREPLGVARSEVPQVSRASAQGRHARGAPPSAGTNSCALSPSNIDASPLSPWTSIHRPSCERRSGAFAPLQRHETQPLVSLSPSGAYVSDPTQSACGSLGQARDRPSGPAFPPPRRRTLEAAGQDGDRTPKHVKTATFRRAVERWQPGQVVPTEWAMPQYHASQPGRITM